MHRILKIGILATTLSAMPLIAHAVHFEKYTRHVRQMTVEETSRDTLLSIMNACGHVQNLDDDCVTQELDRVSTEENNSYAKSILDDYEKALNEGNAQDLECQTDNHMQVNRTIGHCILLLNFFALEVNDLKYALHQYEICLQGGMLGLAYQGNLAAQYFLTKIFEEKEMPEPAFFWKKNLKHHKDSDAYFLLMKCYH